MVHGVWVYAVLDAELEGSLVGLGLLTARIGIAGQLLAEVAKEASGKGSCGGVDGCDAVAGGYDKIGGTVGVADLLINKVTQLVADDGKDFVVVHGIHQSSVDTHTTIAAGKSVDCVGLIDLVIQVQILDVLESSHDAVETLRIVVAGRQDGVLSY